MWVLAPTGEILFFARMSDMDVVNAENAGAIFRQTKVSKRNPPDAASSCALTVLSGFAGRDFLSLQQSTASLPCPYGLFPTKPPVLGAA
ncbi:hypothetical protein [Methyloglobulus morosus]|uniref:hypothetical protein n=1 Tax=Methyloglobulus morosus TaxID=1410681 RepID=UPI0005607F2D|nr:hypothetical protein [Methyloglobulus morosus]